MLYWKLSNFDHYIYVIISSWERSRCFLHFRRFFSSKLLWTNVFCSLIFRFKFVRENRKNTSKISIFDDVFVWIFEQSIANCTRISSKLSQLFLWNSMTFSFCLWCLSKYSIDIFRLICHFHRYFFEKRDELNFVFVRNQKTCKTIDFWTRNFFVYIEQQIAINITCDTINNIR